MQLEEALRKTVALLRLAKSSNANEAALAAAKAQELINKYQLDVTGADYDANAAELEREEVKDFGRGHPIDKVPKIHRGWALRLVSVVAEVNGARVYQSVNSDNKGGKTLMIVGRPSDVNTVRYLYDYFKLEILRLASENTKGNSETYKNHYRIGVVDAITAKLHEQKQKSYGEARAEHANNPLALVRVNNAIARLEKRTLDVSKFMKEKMNLRGGASSGYNKTETGGRAAGRRDGEGIRMTGARGSLGSGTKQIGG